MSSSNRKCNLQRKEGDQPLRVLLAVPAPCGLSGKGKGQGDSFSLAAPFRTDRPVRLPVLFCLGRVERREGQMHMVWDFDSRGNPILPHKQEKRRTD